MKNPQPQNSWYDSLEASRITNETYRNVRWYGAHGDGVTDDTAAFMQALTCAFFGNPFYRADVTNYASGEG